MQGKNIFKNKDNFIFSLFNWFKAKKTLNNTFVIFNTACFGDVLLCNSLCQNIKTLYPNSKVVFVVDKTFVDAAKFQKDVDEVIAFDKNGEHKSFLGILKFIKDFEYKQPYASFVTYRSAINFAIAKMIGSKYCVSGKIYKNPLSTQIKHNSLLKAITNNSIKNYPIKFNVKPEIPEKLLGEISENNKYIVLCTISKKESKDMPIEIATEFIKRINKDNQYKILFVGVGDKCQKYADLLKDRGCNFIDLVDKTSILELAQLVKICKASVSVDTGTLHLSYALGVPTVAVFYDTGLISNWAPDENLYNVKVLDANSSVETIITEMENVIVKGEVDV
jgi:ADP-heptose:LPS heptosyltransferase